MERNIPNIVDSSRTVLNNGKGGGIRLLIVKGSILRVITFWKFSEKYTILKKSRYFWVPPRISISYMHSAMGGGDMPLNQ